MPVKIMDGIQIYEPDPSLLADALLWSFTSLRRSHLTTLDFFVGEAAGLWWVWALVYFQWEKSPLKSSSTVLWMVMLQGLTTCYSFGQLGWDSLDSTHVPCSGERHFLNFSGVQSQLELSQEEEFMASLPCHFPEPKEPLQGVICITFRASHGLFQACTAPKLCISLPADAIVNQKNGVQGKVTILS